MFARRRLLLTPNDSARYQWNVLIAASRTISNVTAIRSTIALPVGWVGRVGGRGSSFTGPPRSARRGSAAGRLLVADP